MVQAADHLEVLQPVRFSSTAAYWPASPMLSRTLAGSRVIEAGDGRSLVRREKRGQDPHRVVFPAPLGPSSPKTLLASTLRSIPAERLDLAVALAEALSLDCGGGGSHGFQPTYRPAWPRSRLRRFSAQAG